MENNYNHKEFVEFMEDNIRQLRKNLVILDGMCKRLGITDEELKGDELHKRIDDLYNKVMNHD